MNNTDLPPLPPIDPTDPQLCELVRRYLAIAPDLSEEQHTLLLQHLQRCPACLHELQMYTYATRLVGGLAESQPSARVDQAVLAALTNPTQIQPRVQQRRAALSRRSLVTALAACLPVLLLALFGLSRLFLPGFSLPAELSWNSYVLYHSQTLTDASGHRYHVQTYHDLTQDRMNVETVMDDEVHIVVVSNAHETLGRDEMHRIVQRNTSAWQTDEAPFDLAELRSDLQSGKATYLGKDSFKGQQVYRIRLRNGLILLLDTHYMPVNVLHEDGAQQKADPMYDQISWLVPTKVSNTLWQMDVPQGYQMGELPAEPPMQ